jgi:hypothetical protein
MSTEGAAPEQELGAPRPAQAAERCGGSQSPSVKTQSHRSLELLGTILPPASALLALLYYFGWVRTRAFWADLGVEPSVLGFTIQDYLLRSIDGLFVPLGIALTLGLVLLWIHNTVLELLLAKRHLVFIHRTASTMVPLGLALFAFGISAFFPTIGEYFLLTPLSLAFGPALVVYGTSLRSRVRNMRSAQEIAGQGPAIAKTLLAMLVTVNIFWAISSFADAVGRGTAESVRTGLTRLPGVVIYSHQQLNIRAPGVKEKSIGDSDAAYQFRYEGLHLMLRSAGRLFLLAQGWSSDNASIIVLRDNEGIRVEFNVQRIS